MMQYRDRLLRKFHRTHSKETKALYKKFHNRVAKNIRKSTVKYFHELFTQNKGSMKKFWSGIRSIVNLKNKSLNNISQLISDDGNIIKDSKNGYCFQQLFVNVSQKSIKIFPEQGNHH